MLKTIFSVILILAFASAGICQTKEIVDREIALIQQIPQNHYVLNKKQRIKADNHYKAILKLDTNAIPFLIDKVTDTTQTAILFLSQKVKLRVGDVAYSLIKDIERAIPVGAVFKIENCLLTNDGSLDYNLILLNRDRQKVQNELRSFYQSPQGRAWVRLIKYKPSAAEREELYKQL